MYVYTLYYSHTTFGVVPYTQSKSYLFPVFMVTVLKYVLWNISVMRIIHATLRYSDLLFFTNKVDFGRTVRIIPLIVIAKRKGGTVLQMTGIVWLGRSPI